MKIAVILNEKETAALDSILTRADLLDESEDETCLVRDRLDAAIAQAERWATAVRREKQSRKVLRMH